MLQALTELPAQPVLDAHAFGSMPQVADNLILETTVDLAGGRGDAMPQKAHHIQEAGDALAVARRGSYPLSRPRVA